MESRRRLFYFDIRYKTGAGTRQGKATSQGKASRQGKGYKPRKSEHNGIEEETILV